MPWRQSTGHEACNECRRPIPAREPLWAGARTPATWCETCARERLGEVIEGDVPKTLPIGMAGFDARAMSADLRGRIVKWREDARQKQTGEPG